MGHVGPLAPFHFGHVVLHAAEQASDQQETGDGNHRGGSVRWPSRAGVGVCSGCGSGSGSGFARCRDGKTQEEGGVTVARYTP